MSGSRSNTSEKFAKASMDRSTAAFSTGLPLFQHGVGMSREAMENPEPEYMRRALDAALSNAGDASYISAGNEAAGAALQAKGAVGAGNTSQILTPESYGARFARFLADSQSTRQNAKISQMLDAAGVGVGQAGSAGELQLKGLSNQLGAISMRPTVDPTYSSIVGAAALAGSIYGSGQQAGWWGQSAQTKALPASRSYSGFVGPSSALLQPLPTARNY